MKIKILSTLILPIILMIVLVSGCNYDTIIPETIDPGVQVSFSEDIIPIFNADCNTSGCHTTGAVAPDLSPANAYGALTNGNYIDTNNPEASELYQWVNGNRNAPMPLDGVNPQTVAIILLWIQQGALDN